MKVINQAGNITIKEAYTDFFKGYFDFKGRTTIKGFWVPFLLNIIIATLISLVFSFTSVFQQIFGFAFAIAIVIPTAASLVRRMNDAGLSTTIAIILVIANFLLGGIKIINIFIAVSILVISLLPSKFLAVK